MVDRSVLPAPRRMSRPGAPVGDRSPVPTTRGLSGPHGRTPRRLPGRGPIPSLRWLDYLPVTQQAPARSSGRGPTERPLGHGGHDYLGVTQARRRVQAGQRAAGAGGAINPAEPVDWGDLAGGAGYFDQAHFGHEFRAFTGLTPTRYVGARRRFLREHPGHALDGWPLPAD